MCHGLFFTGGGRAALVTVTEVGATTAQSDVTILYLDPEERVLARGTGVLKRAQPVSLELPLNIADSLVQVRAAITIAGQPARRSSPIVVLENIDANSFTIEPRVICAPPASLEGPVLPNCPGVVGSIVNR